MTSTNIAHTLETAVAHHQSGHLAQAEKLYRQIIRLDPSHADALNLLGVAMHQRRQSAAAAEYISRAISLNRKAAPYHCHLGMVYRALDQLDEAVECYREAIRLEPDSLEAHFNLGIALSAQDEFGEAEQCFERTLVRKPKNVDVLINLGNSQQSQEKYADALDSFRQVLEIEPDNFKADFNIGNCLNEQERYEEAAESFQRAVATRPDCAVAHFNLANSLQLLERLEESIPVYDTALRIDPNYREACNNLGGAWYAQRKFDDAAACYRRALEIDSEYAEAHNNLGRTQHKQGKLSDALESIRRALEIEPDCANAYLNMGEVYCSAREFEPARQCFQQVVRLEEGNVEGWMRLAGMLKLQHRIEDAAEAYRHGLGETLVHQPLPQLWLATLCPAIFENNEQIEECRDRIFSEVRRLADLRPQLEFSEIAALGCMPPPNLQFQRYDNRPLLEAFASIFRGHLPQETPPAGRGKPKIGFVVTSSHEGIFYRFVGSLIERLNRDLIEPVIVCSATGAETIRNLRRSDSVELLTVTFRHDLLAEEMREARFDVLYHFEVGTDVTNYFLPFFRLAPVQCTSGGNSQTTGLEEIDYFLSSDLQEPPDAADHYTETLIRVPAMPSYQQRVVLPSPAKSREAFGFSDSQNLYFCAQKLQKILPDFDPILAEVLRRDPNGVLILVQDHIGYVANLLRQRMSKTMSDVVDRVVFVPRQSIADYLSLMAASDVLLDPLHYGGGSTMYDAMSLGKPVVTLPGEFVRSRYALGFYRKMGFETCIASSPEDYVNLAVALGTDVDFRRSVEEEIGERSGVIFEDTDVVREYERIFLELVDQARSR